MRRIHVLTQKEEINPDKVHNCIVIVLDVLLATSTITTLLAHGAKRVIPVHNEQEAREVSRTLAEDTYLLSGEMNGNVLPAFLYPCPLYLMNQEIAGKTIILSTSNGTVALKNASGAHRVYAGSMLNARAIAKHIAKEDENHSILLACAGNQGRFSMEDFLGAGLMIKEMMEHVSSSFSLSDGANAALSYYSMTKETILDHFHQSETGNLLKDSGFTEAIAHCCQRNVYETIPLLQLDTYPYVCNVKNEKLEVTR